MDFGDNERQLFEEENKKDPFFKGGTENKTNNSFY